MLWGGYLQPRKFNLMQAFILRTKLNILIENRWFNELKAKDYPQKHTKVKRLDCYLVNFIYSDYIIWIIPTKVPPFL